MSNPHSSVGSTPTNPNDNDNDNEVQSVPAQEGSSAPPPLADPDATAIVPQPNALQPVPQPQPLPLLPLNYQEIRANYEHECHVCQGRFFNMRALCGHMRVHKNRDWRGLKPPSDQGSSRPPTWPANIGFPYPKPNFYPGVYNPFVFNPSGVAVVGGGTRGSGFQNNPLALQWQAPQWYNYRMPTMGLPQGTSGVGGSSNVGEGGGEGRDPGKRPLALPERRSKRSKGSSRMPDLNLSPPPEDESEDGEGGEDEEGEGRGKTD